MKTHHNIPIAACYKSVQSELKKTTQVRDSIWNFLLRNIDHPEWSNLKRTVNRLNNNIDNLKKQNIMNSEFTDMRQNRKQAQKALKKVREYRTGKKFKMVQVDKKTWKEVVVNE